MSKFCADCRYSEYQRGNGIISSCLTILCCTNPTVREYKHCRYDDKLKVDSCNSCKLFEPKLTADDIGFK